MSDSNPKDLEKENEKLRKKIDKLRHNKSKIEDLIYSSVSLKIPEKCRECKYYYHSDDSEKWKGETEHAYESDHDCKEEGCYFICNPCLNLKTKKN